MLFGCYKSSFLDIDHCTVIFMPNYAEQPHNMVHLEEYIIFSKISITTLYRIQSIIHHKFLKFQMNLIFTNWRHHTSLHVNPQGWKFLSVWSIHNLSEAVRLKWFVKANMSPLARIFLGSSSIPKQRILQTPCLFNSCYADDSLRVANLHHTDYTYLRWRWPKFGRTPTRGTHQP